MLSCYNEITKFQNNLTINVSYDLINKDTGEVVSSSSHQGKVQIRCYSMTTRQKWTEITLVALVVIGVVLGASSLGGTNMMGNQAAWAIIGTGSGLAVLMIGSMIYRHLQFVKDVGRFLSAEHLECWNDRVDYPGIEPGEIQIEEFASKNGIIYCKKYSVSSYLSNFYIEFYKTLPN